MNIAVTPISLICLLFFFMAGLLFVKRFIYTLNTRKANNRTINYKWFGWYGSIAITGTSTDWYKLYMRKFNKLTAAMWTVILLGVIIYLFNKFYLLYAII